MDRAGAAENPASAAVAHYPREVSGAVAAWPSLIDTAGWKRLRTHGSRTAKIAVVAADAIALAVAMALAAWIRHELNEKPVVIEPIWLTAVLAIPIWLCVFARYKLYRAAAVTSRIAEISRIIHANAAGAACTGLVALVLAAQISRVWLLLTFVIAVGTAVVERSIVRGVFRRARVRGQLQRPVVIIGTNDEGLDVAEMLQANTQLGYKVVGLLDAGTDATIGVVTSIPVLGTSNDAVDILQSLDATGVIIATSAIDVVAANRLTRALMELGYHVELTSGLVDISAERLLTRALGRRPVVYIEPVRRFGWRAHAKRLFDFVLAGGLLVLTAPVLAVAAVLIKLDSPGPVFFSQVRVGEDGKLFRVKKLRTMVNDAEQRLEILRDLSEADGPLFKMRDDPRVTRVGRFLRKWSIDELPQFWNVLRNEMSIVGPRPALPSELSGWTDELQGRLRVKPGITGMWQVNGRSASSFEDYTRHDLYYVDNWSLLTDLAIVAKTVPVVLFGRGSY